MVIHMLIHTMTMKWRPYGGAASMKTSECSTQKLLFLTTTLSVNVSATLGSVTGTERGSEITVRGSAGRERGRENGSARRRGCDGKKSGRETG